MKEILKRLGGASLALGAALLTGCSVEASYSSTPTQTMSVRHENPFFVDTVNGVACYSRHSYSLSCVRVRP